MNFRVTALSGFSTSVFFNRRALEVLPARFRPLLRVSAAQLMAMGLMGLGAANVNAQVVDASNASLKITPQLIYLAAIDVPGAGGDQANTATTAAAPAESTSAADGNATNLVGIDQQSQREQKRSQDAQVAAQQAAIIGKRLTVETGLTYTRVDRRQLAVSGFYALDAIFLGRLTLDQVKGNTWTFDVTTRYGLTDRMSVDLNVPFLYRDNLFISEGVGSAGNQTSDASVNTSNVGDVSLGLSYQLQKKAVSNVDTIASIRLRAPTGRDPFGIALVNPTDPNNANTANTNLNIPERLPTGNGVWSLITNVSFIKTLDPLVLFGNVGYIYNQKRSFDDISSGQGVPGSIKLGDSLQLGAGFAFAVNDTTSFSLSSNILASRTSKTQQSGQAWQEVSGSSGNAATFNVGLTHAFSKKLSVSTNLALGMTNDAPNYSVGVRIPYTF